MALRWADSTGLLRVKAQEFAGLLPAFQLLDDALRRRLVILSPVFLVLGIWCYFAIGNEPSSLLCGAVGLAIPVLAYANRSSGIVLSLLILALGFTLAKFRAEWVATPLIRAFQSDVLLEGYVADVERRGRVQTVIVDVSNVIGLSATEAPLSVRLRVTSSQIYPQTGDKVRTLANVFPLPRPVQPGAFDFGRQLYFKSIGGMGESRNGISAIAADVPFKYKVRRSFHRLRQIIGARVNTVVEGPLGAFADAIITGERAAIPNSMTESLQRSGLFHILSISGLHMSLVAGGIFWLTRALLALVPRWALRYPIKKWAAVVALFMGFFYMLLADSGAATERSYIMIAVMLFAVLVDRPAISLHNLAIAAIIILVSQPEQAMAASFQMSFMAVMGIAAFFEWWTTHVSSDWQGGQSPSNFYVRKIFRILLTAFATSLVAGTLSSIPAAYHFGRLAPFSVVANMLALPIVGIIIMPMALVGTLLMPFGFEYLPYKLMQFGLGLLMQISDRVAGWQWSNVTAGNLGLAPAIALALAATFLCLVTTRWRLVGLPLAALALWASGQPLRPDILIEERTRNVAIRNSDGQLVVALPGRSRFATDRWLRIDGDAGVAKGIKARKGWSCSVGICSASTAGQTVAFLLPEAEAHSLCPPVDVLIASYPLRKTCKGKKVTIDRFDVWRTGAVAVGVDESGLDVRNTVATQGVRPWVYLPRPRYSTNLSTKSGS